MLFYACAWKRDLLLLTLARPQESETHHCQTCNNEITHAHALQPALCYRTIIHLVILKLCAQLKEMIGQTRLNKEQCLELSSLCRCQTRSYFSSFTSSFKANISDNLSHVTLKKGWAGGSKLSIWSKKSFYCQLIVIANSVSKSGYGCLENVEILDRNLKYCCAYCFSADIGCTVFVPQDNNISWNKSVITAERSSLVLYFVMFGLSFTVQRQSPSCLAMVGNVASLQIVDMQVQSFKLPA